MNSPGVRNIEMDFSDYVQSVANVSAGCVGGARRGPLSPTLVTSQAELIKTFGEPREGDYGIYGALAALAQAGQLYYQRVIPEGDKAKAGSTGTDKFTFEAVKTGDEFNGVKVKTTAPTEAGIFTVTVHSETGGLLETFADVSKATDNEKFLPKVMNGSSDYVKAILNDTGEVTEKEYTLAGGANGAELAKAGTDTDEFQFWSKYCDSTINDCEVVVDKEDDFGYFNVKLVDDEGKIVEGFTALSRNPKDERFVERYINKFSERITTKYTKDGTTTNKYVFAGGTDGMSLITDNDILGDIIDNTGLEGFRNKEEIEINLLMIPGRTSNAVVQAAIALCEQREDTLFICDTPFGLKPQRVNEWANGTGIYSDRVALNTSYGAVYYPWVKVADTYTDQDVWLPPSGYIIAQMAYNDKVAFPWFAPAGLNRGMVGRILDIELSPNQGERDLLYGERNIVNPLVKFKGIGITIWGQKTMQRKCSALDRVNVRRLLCHLKKVIGRSTQYYVFEPNDEFTWDRWIDMVEPALKNIKDQRGIYDMKISMEPVPFEIDNYEMPGKIMIKPTKTAEFIPLYYMIMPTGASFEE